MDQLNSAQRRGIERVRKRKNRLKKRNNYVDNQAKRRELHQQKQGAAPHNRERLQKEIDKISFGNH